MSHSDMPPNKSVERGRPQAALVGSLRGFAATASTHVKRYAPMARFSDTYIDHLFAGVTYDALVELAGIICGWSGFSEKHPDRRLPPVAFVFLETLTWFSQGIRSGSWTYFEATSVERQLAVLSCLERMAPVEFVERYREGVEHWRDQDRMRDHDRWIDSNESVCNQWLINLLSQSRKDLADLFA